MEHRVLPLEGSGDITWLSGKEIGRQFKRRRFNPWVAKIPWRRKRQPTPAFLPGKPHGQKSLVGYGPWGRKEESGVAERRNNNRRHHQSLRRAGPNAGSLPGDGTMCSQWNATEGIRDEGRGANNSSTDRTEGVRDGRGNIATGNRATQTRIWGQAYPSKHPQCFLACMRILLGDAQCAASEYKKLRYAEIRSVCVWIANPTKVLI